MSILEQMWGYVSYCWPPCSKFIVYQDLIFKLKYVSLFGILTNLKYVSLFGILTNLKYVNYN
jgi:uncharacterized metal-binding protein